MILIYYFLELNLNSSPENIAPYHFQSPKQTKKLIVRNLTSSSNLKICWRTKKISNNTCSISNSSHNLKNSKKSKKYTLPQHQNVYLSTQSQSERDHKKTTKKLPFEQRIPKLYVNSSQSALRLRLCGFLSQSSIKLSWIITPQSTSNLCSLKSLLRFIIHNSYKIFFLRFRKGNTETL